MSIRPIKRLGQNFLRDPNTAAKIASTVNPLKGQTVVEIGAGEGALTEHLLERCERLTVIEVDERAVRHVQTRFPDLDVRHADVLDVDWPALSKEAGGKLLVVGNLPYNITSPILFRLLAASSVLTEIVVMMQLEVAQRIVAEPRSKAYGSLSVGVQLQTHPELLFKVSRNVFQPKPKVTSAVVRMRVRENSPDQVVLDQIRTVVRTAFNQRRKKMRNSLSSFLPDRAGPISPADEEMVSEFEREYGSKRAEELSPTQFIELSRLLGVL